MFGIFFGWQKASKCKKMIKRARCRLKQLKNKRQVIATQLRKDLAELIQNDQEETAIKRVEQLIQDECLVAAYELIDRIFEFILKKISYIRCHKDCPPDINEAVSSLIFASSRFGDFPELYVIRKFFGQRYGEDFATAAVEQLPGNLVNQKLIENLTIKSLPDDLKYRVIDEIARDNCLQPEVKEHEGNQLVESEAQMYYTVTASKINPSEVEEIERDVTCVNPSITKPSDTYYLPGSTLTETSALVSTVQQYPHNLTYHALQKEVEKDDFHDLHNKEERLALVPSSVSLLPYAETMLDYVHDIEESQFSVSKDDYCQDQRLLLGCDDSDIDQDKSTSERSSIRGFRTSKQTPKKKLRRSANLLESQGIMEIECIIYYQKPCKSQKYGTQYKTMRKKSNYLHKRQKQHTSLEEENCIQSCQSQGITKRSTSNFYLCECSLDQPCYCCLYNDQCWGGFSIGWPKTSKDNLLKTYSSTSPQPKHVHPKLSDYEDIVAIFTALKRERESAQLVDNENN